MQELLSSSSPYIFVLPTVFLLAIVQSLMGVGLLLFGTPSLLVLGFGFSEALALLLPCSMAVNACQLCGGLPANRGVVFRIMWVTLPMLLMGLLVVLNGIDARWMPLLVGAMLMCLGVLRVSARASNLMKRVVTKYQRTYIAAMGLIHGMTNMGGGLLVVFAGTVSDDKEEIRGTIALGYLMFASAQLATLALLKPQDFHREHLLLPLVAGLTYILGNLLFRRMNSAQFGRLVTALILVYGVISIGKAVA